MISLIQIVRRSVSNKCQTIATPMTLNIAQGQLYPASGVLLLSDTQAHQARITAQSATQYKLELDMDGNVVFETMAMGDWSALPLM